MKKLMEHSLHAAMMAEQLMDTDGANVRNLTGEKPREMSLSYYSVVVYYIYE